MATFLSLFSFRNRLDFFILFSALVVSVPTISHAASSNELKGVKNEISRQKDSVSTQQKKLNELQNTLKKQELSISDLENQITKTKTSLTTSNNNIKKIDAEIAQLNKLKKQQSDTLAELIKTYYVTQRAKTATSILNNGVEEDRISQYFQHLAKARAITIDSLEQTRQALNKNQRQLQLEQQKIAQLLEQQTTKRNSLKQNQTQRNQTVNKIKKSISSDQVYLSELQRNETRLKAEIAKAAKRNAVPMDGLAKQKGKLPWPIKGKLLHSYGSKQAGQSNWNGIVIDADYGQAIKSVYPGTVVFAEYLRGYGLVVLLDHGKGDMTLYGFNQTLVKKEGDKVAAGETIALAGDTGGQSRPSLYFELRRNSKTQNPKSWLTR
ncbi:murein hydrolase activator EnvC family protein [Vibrio genomosp. F10]|uniref:Peptidase M23 n=1 Tax=Vibrio genomosp. F10 str. ZF-129 TaxID=1187848 RepID=A0A1E5BGH0_9VIBR|nr:murein hydrolase activator EnvC [Vibrio genomosp. F10]OEE35378.1 peptidase M23 [Vibrio genomosp. F10 str. ZF-129]OEE98427.1 peptidase M23 [Vibrio genomosp. F10 str. 9ZC157]OEF00970.1 peptidase M23 [Vibrio genomosp. F10 str. 9ZD137]OEF05019.1 peptidase M23 [Vibrio genomosp. F10 str. 9ZB36]